jgi:hypothetical protein
LFLILSVLVVMACGYIVYSSTENNPAGTDSAGAINLTQASPTAEALVNVTVTPYPNSTATPSPTIEANNSINSSVVCPELPPAVIFTHVPAAGEGGTVTGTITGVDPSQYRLAVYIYVNGLFNVPSDSAPLTTINSDGSWACNISDGGMGARATEVDAYIVPANFSAPILSGREYSTNAIKYATVACNGAAIKPAKA